jgi:hypothetical protein
MRRSAVFIVSFAVVVVLALWGYSAFRTSTTRAEIAALVKDSAERLKPALAPPAEPSDFDGAARAVDGHVVKLRKLDTSRVLPFADAADGYLVTVREILRRRAAMQDARERLGKSLEIFTQHVQTDRGGAAWTGEAVRLRENADRDFRDYRVASESYAALLETLPEAQTRTAEHVKTMWLADERTVKDARTGVLDALARTDENIRKITQLDAYRVKRRQGAIR